MRCLLPGLAAASLVACSAPKPSASPVPAVPSAPVLVAPSAPVPVAPIAPKPIATPQPPLVQPTPAKSDPTGDPAPPDCSKFVAGKAPDVRWLCEIAAGTRPVSSILDQYGYAFVAYHFDGGVQDTIQVKGRKCGAEAEKHLATELIFALRFQFEMWAMGAGPVSCEGLTCTLQGMGEYGVTGTLGFRRTPKGPVLDWWTAVELGELEERTVAKRKAWVRAGLGESRGRRCK